MIFFFFWGGDFFHNDFDSLFLLTIQMEISMDERRLRVVVAIMESYNIYINPHVFIYFNFFMHTVHICLNPGCSPILLLRAVQQQLGNQREYCSASILQAIKVAIFKLAGHTPQCSWRTQTSLSHHYVVNLVFLPVLRWQQICHLHL